MLLYGIVKFARLTENFAELIGNQRVPRNCTLALGVAKIDNSCESVFHLNYTDNTKRTIKKVKKINMTGKSIKVKAKNK